MMLNDWDTYKLNTNRYIHRGSIDYSDQYGNLVRVYGCRLCGSLVANPDREIHDSEVHNHSEPLTS